LPEDTASDEKEMSFSICDDWIETCAIEFLRPLIEIVEPRAIITLGKEAFKGVAYAYSCHKAWGIRPCADFSLAKIVDRTPFKIDGNILVFPVFHPSYRHINRPAPKNTKDWAIIKGHLDKIQERA
jgi:uracil-DNA glycosylase